MTLQELYDISRLFSTYKLISYIGRVSDNVILMRLDTINYNIDLNKNSPCVYITNNITKEKNYNAPFDIALQKYVNKATLNSCVLNKMNKILIFELISKNKYKELQITLYIEFITRQTNMIIVENTQPKKLQNLDSKNAQNIISALRFYENDNRVIMPNAPFTPLKQPHFTKILSDNDIESTKLKLLQNYTELENKCVESKRKILTHNIESKITKLDRILKSLPNVTDLQHEIEQNLYIANYILSNLDSIPKYADNIQIKNKNYDIPVTAKPSLASDKLFKNAKKLKQKLQNLNIQKENLESKVTFLHNELAFIQNANLNELNILQQNLYPKKNMSKKETKKYYESFYINGIRVSVGRNASENIRLLKDSKADFIWLHILNMPSSHMIIHANKVDSNTLELAGRLLARLNGKMGKIVIDYTKRKFVKVTNGSNVIYSKESKLHLNI